MGASLAGKFFSTGLAARIFAFATASIFVFAVVHRPILVVANAPDDDGLFMRLGEQILQTGWLGPFDNLTLVKGPVYPFFLAANSWLGLPLTFAHALLFCVGAGLFAVSIKRATGSRWLAALLFAALAFYPDFVGARIIRDEIYPSEMLMMFGCLVFALFTDSRRRILWGFGAGLALAAAWLTREEGPWLLPMVGMLAIIGIVRSWRSGRKILLSSLAAVLIGFAAPNLIFGLGNLIAYGSFVGVDFKERNLVAAMAALESVKDGGEEGYVPVPHAAREAAYAVSPTFKRLEAYLDPPGGTSPWQDGCRFVQSTCGDIAGGWFIWALRDAASSVGGYKSPATAAALFRSIADEINRACSAGELHCHRNLLASLTSFGAGVYAGDPVTSFERAMATIFLAHSTVAGGTSTGASPDFENALALANYPPHTPRTTDRRIRVSGWYYAGTNVWPTWRLTNASGAEVAASVDRVASSDIAAHFHDPAATNQRFLLTAACDGSCALTVSAPGLPDLKTGIAALTAQPGPRVAGAATLFVDSATTQTQIPASPAETVSRAIREAALTIYRAGLPFAASIAVAGFLIGAFLAIRQKRDRVLAAIAASVWLGVFVRLAVVIHVDITALPVAVDSVRYLWPASFLLVAAVALSIGLFVRRAGYMMEKSGKSPATAAPAAFSL